MNKVVYKYPVVPEEDGRIRITMPKNGSVLDVQKQGDNFQMWVEVNPDAEAEVRHFRAIPTGMPFESSDVLYVKTIQIDGGRLIFHIYEDYMAKEGR